MILARVPLAEHFEEETVKLTAMAAFLGLMICAAPAFPQQEEIPKNIAELSQDIFRVPRQELPKTESVLTLVGGKIVYDAKVMSAR